eukprot:257931-Pyramimonas_sp.AAC.2
MVPPVLWAPLHRAPAGARRPRRPMAPRPPEPPHAGVAARGSNRHWSAFRPCPFLRRRVPGALAAAAAPRDAPLLATVLERRVKAAAALCTQALGETSSAGRTRHSSSLECHPMLGAPTLSLHRR